MSQEQLKKVTDQNYPTGRAHGVNKGGVRDQVNDGLIVQEAELYDFSMEILNELLPDNDDFTTQFATNWEQRLGMITDPLIPLADRKAAILRKMNHPGDIPARQSWDYMQQQLQLANFDVYVFDNTTGMTINQVLNMGLTTTGNWGSNNFGAFNFGSVYSYYSGLFGNQAWGSNNFGSFNFGGQTNYTQKVVNNIDWTKDSNFIVNDWTKAFYIGAADLGTFADVLTTRREEFRQLILRTKPVNTAAFLLINYT